VTGPEWLRTPQAKAGVLVGVLALVVAFGAGWAIGRAGNHRAGMNEASGSSSAEGRGKPRTPTPAAVPNSGAPVSPPASLPAGTVPAAPIAEFTCPAATVEVSTADELTAALARAKPGDVIHLKDGTYQKPKGGEFTATGQGTEQQPIYLCGGPGAVLQSDGFRSGYVLHLANAAYWRVDGFTVRNGQKGVVVDASHHIALQNLTVVSIGDEAIHLRDNTTDSVVRGNTIRNTGNRRDKFGEGVYVGSAVSNWTSVSGGRPDTSDRNFVLNNTISATTAESVDIKEGTTGGVVAGNTFDGAGFTDADSWVDVKGNDWLIAGNRGRTSPKDGFQTHVIIPGWGDRNRFVDNTADVDGGAGVGFYLHHQQSNQVSCGNEQAGAAKGLSNYPCQK
jgi:parallel beta helix pectate lyase-like protein